MFAAECAAREPDIVEVEAAMAEAAGLANAAQGRLVALVADGLARGVWHQDGVQSASHWLTWQLGVASGQARRLLVLARRAPELPATMAAFTAGELSFDQAAVIARHVPADHERSAVVLARQCTVRQLTRALSRYAFEPSDPDAPPEAPVPEPERRSVSFGGSDDGRWHLRADLPRRRGRSRRAGPHRRHQDLFGQQPGDTHGDAPGEATAGEGRTRVTWADALVCVSESYLRCGEAALPAAGRFLINAHLETDPTDPGAPGGLSVHLHSPLPDALRRLIGCDTTIRAVHETSGLPVSVGRSMRIVPERTRRQIEHRDGGCAVPGCAATRFLQIHHITHWENGGATDRANLVALCRRHHREHHQGRLTITGNPDRPPGHPDTLAFTDAHGRPIGPAARPRPPRRQPPTAPYRHPTGERLDTRWLHLPPDNQN
ncbi:MAG: HNH endonuclease [Acidimicrobiia bacterium]|nr:HNH endonuclease [Acidimicrobiia bacterium]